MKAATTLIACLALLVCFASATYTNIGYNGLPYTIPDGSAGNQDEGCQFYGGFLARFPSPLFSNVGFFRCFLFLFSLIVRSRYLTFSLSLHGVCCSGSFAP